MGIAISKQTSTFFEYLKFWEVQTYFFFQTISYYGRKGRQKKLFFDFDEKIVIPNVFILID